MKHVFFIVIFLLEACVILFSSAAQSSVSSKSGEITITTQHNQSVILLGSYEVNIKSNQGISIRLKGRGWMFDIANSDVFSSEDHIIFVAVEDMKNESNFLFYRISQGKDTLQFRRYDNEADIMYSYMLWIHWIDEYITHDDVIHNDKYVKVTQIPLDVLQVSQNIDQNEDERIDLDNINTSTIPDSNTYQSETDITEMSASENTSVNTEIPEVNNNIDIISNNILQNETLIDEDSILSLDGTDTNKVTTNTQQKDSSLSDDQSVMTPQLELIDMSYDQIKNHIIENYNTRTFSELIVDIEKWRATHDNILEQSSLLWYFGQLIENNLKTATDIINMYALYSTIIEKYPLSYEYFDAQQKIKKLKLQYMFVLEE